MLLFINYLIYHFSGSATLFFRHFTAMSMKTKVSCIGQDISTFKQVIVTNFKLCVCFGLGTNFK